MRVALAVAVGGGRQLALARRWLFPPAPAASGCFWWWWCDRFRRRRRRAAARPCMALGLGIGVGRGWPRCGVGLALCSVAASPLCLSSSRCLHLPVCPPHAFCFPFLLCLPLVSSPPPPHPYLLNRPRTKSDEHRGEQAAAAHNVLGRDRHPARAQQVSAGAWASRHGGRRRGHATQLAPRHDPFPRSRNSTGCGVLRTRACAIVTEAGRRSGSSGRYTPDFTGMLVQARAFRCLDPFLPMRAEHQSDVDRPAAHAWTVYCAFLLAGEATASLSPTHPRGQ